MHEDAAEASFWGVKLSSDTGLMRANPPRLWPLVMITTRVAQLGLCSRPLLESLVGSWTSVVLLRRRCLCLFQVVFAALRASAGDEVIRLSSALIDELWTFVLVAPLCVADL